jgi:hypothetical protein
MTRSEHLEWAKKRAVEYLANGDLLSAFLSMVSDLGKHDELCNHPAITLGTQMQIGGHLKTPEKMRDFINGFN